MSASQNAVAPSPAMAGRRWNGLGHPAAWVIAGLLAVLAFAALAAAALAAAVLGMLGAIASVLWGLAPRSPASGREGRGAPEGWVTEAAARR